MFATRRLYLWPASSAATDGSEMTNFVAVVGLSGHSAGSFTAMAFIAKSAGQGGVLIGSPVAASTWLPAAIVACAANISAFASMSCCGEGGSIVVNNDSQLRECR